MAVIYSSKFPQSPRPPKMEEPPSLQASEGTLRPQISQWSLGNALIRLFNREKSSCQPIESARRRDQLLCPMGVWGSGQCYWNQLVQCYNNQLYYENWNLINWIWSTNSWPQSSSLNMNMVNYGLWKGRTLVLRFIRSVLCAINKTVLHCRPTAAVSENPRMNGNGESLAFVIATSVFSQRHYTSRTTRVCAEKEKEVLDAKEQCTEWIQGVL